MELDLEIYFKIGRPGSRINKPNEALNNKPRSKIKPIVGNAIDSAVWL